MLEYCKHLP